MKNSGLKRRIIPVIFLRGGHIVQSKEFRRYQILGNPFTMVSRFSNWLSDELIYLDITRDDVYDLNRDDLNCPNLNNFLEIVREFAKKCFVPLTVGGKVRTLKDVEIRLTSGADKVSINTQAFDCPDFVGKCAKEFGSQCIVASIDVKKMDGSMEVFVEGGKRRTSLPPKEWARELETRGAGEILLNSIDRDGTGRGYDIRLINEIVENAVKIPVIALGGAGNYDHLKDVLDLTRVSAVAAGNIFQYTENSVFNAKKHLFEVGCNIREPFLGKRLARERNSE